MPEEPQTNTTEEEPEKPFKWCACHPDPSKGIRITAERARRLALAGERISPNPRVNYGKGI